MFFSQIILLITHNNLKKGETIIYVLQIYFFVRSFIQQNTDDSGPATNGVEPQAS